MEGISRSLAAAYGHTLRRNLKSCKNTPVAARIRVDIFERGETANGISIIWIFVYIGSKIIFNDLPAIECALKYLLPYRGLKPEKFCTLPGFTVRVL